MAWGYGERGYLRYCRECGRTIYLHYDNDGRWRPYESWVAGSVPEGEFVPHSCDSAATEAQEVNLLADLTDAQLVEEFEVKLEELQQLFGVIAVRLRPRPPQSTWLDELPF